ncbi:MAG: HNH endonuclease [Gemmatimonadaceae bacterium]
MSEGCLALNATYEPLTVTPVRRAVRLLLDGKAELVDSDGHIVHSPNLSIPRPAVIRLKAFVRVPRNLRRQVTNTFLFGRDQRTCAYCQRHERDLLPREFLTRDHVVPLSRGGRTTWGNCVTACSSCNARKASKTLAESGMVLHIVPSEPHMVHLVWAVRRLTPLQRHYVERFFGPRVLRTLY